MFPPFNPAEAHNICLNLCKMLGRGDLTLSQVTKISEERKNQGVMIGALVCIKTEGEKIVLIANSGISKSLTFTKNPESSSFFIDGTEYVIVPPIVSAQEIEKALEKNDREIHELTDKIKMLEKAGADEAMSGTGETTYTFEATRELKKRRQFLCDQSLLEVRKLYHFESLVSENGFSIENENAPTGTGDCCEPKLLNYAIKHKLQPVSMDQVYYAPHSLRHSRSLDSQYSLRHSHRLLNPPNENIESVPPCDERCGILLPKMLGLEILYVDEHIVVVNKPGGLLSVPGRTDDKKDCVESRIKAIYPHLCKLNQPSVHRLDMETSGLMVLAFHKEAQKNLQRQFENREIHKDYIALLSGVLEKEACGMSAPKYGEKSGQMNLKFRLDVENRPRQIYDEEFGKEGVTLWENMGLVWHTLEDGKKIKSTKIKFTPKTGRTHQLRLAASDIHGFGLPIIGDTLYGSGKSGDKLMLHAQSLSFVHPITNESMNFFKAPDW